MKKENGTNPKPLTAQFPHMIAITKTSRRSPDRQRNRQSHCPLLKYIDHLKAGTANETDFMGCLLYQLLMVELVPIHKHQNPSR